MIRKALTLAVLGSAALLPAQSITGAGSTFAAPLYNKWASVYKQQHPNVQINYQSIGSGGGIRQLTAGTVDFGGTDGPMTDQQLAEAKNHWHGDILHFPTALGAAVPVYNIPGLNGELNFTPKALAGIYLGQITKWNDPQIASVNPGVKLPATDIHVVHRSDGSGTSYVWTDFLDKADPAFAERVKASTAPGWPVGLGGKGNEGVAGMVRQIPGSIGYVELIYALENKMSYGKVQNSSGKFIKADLNSVTAAAAGAVQHMPADFRVSITNAPGAASYPVSSFTWMLVPTVMPDKNKGEALKQFLIWGLTTGQQYNSGLSYAPVPKPVVEKEMQAIKRLQY